jgi:lipopolysaccharide export system protein LptA
MAVSIARLRRWFLLGVLVLFSVVVGAYFHARHRVENAFKQVGGKIGLNVEQSAEGFTISNSEQGRTLFKLEASRAIQFKQGGRAELHEVTITLYGRDSSRFDQIYGKDFEYDPQSGDVTSRGEVSIDLEANPQGTENPDQAVPKELKNPIHLRTQDLVFNRTTGDAWTKAAVEFRLREASGSSLGARYVGRQSLLTLTSQVKINVSGAKPSTIVAQRGVLRKNPREIVLDQTQLHSNEEQAQADELILSLSDDNRLDHSVASGHVQIELSGARRATVSADRLESVFKPDGGLGSAVFSGEVSLKTQAEEPIEATAGRAELSFRGRNLISRVHAERQVRIVEHQRPSGRDAQDLEMTATVVDLDFRDGGRPRRAESFGPPEILLVPAHGTGIRTEVTADQFVARFDAGGRLRTVHGEAHARTLTSSWPKTGTPEPDRVTTSDSLDAFFTPGSGIATLVEQGHFTYTAGGDKAFARTARYTPRDQMLVLDGRPQVMAADRVTTARRMRFNRASGEGFAEGDVKSTYNDLKPQSSGALLAASDAIHVTAERMAVRKLPAVALYTGGARLWQDANLVSAPSIQFDKDERTILAASDSGAKVSTVLVATDKQGKPTPVRITSSRLAYRDREREAHFEGEVRVSGQDLTITAEEMDVWLQPPAPSGSSPQASQVETGGTDKVSPPSPPPGSGLSQLEKIIASGSVRITEQNRRARGERLVYTASEDKFVLTGGPPSIFDAERGNITGVSLTLFRRDDRVVVEGDSSSPAVSETRVVR